MYKGKLSQLICTVVGLSVQVALMPSAWSYEVIGVTDGGSISGQVTLTGTPPPAAKITVTKDTAVCGRTEKVEEDVVVGPQNGLQNVVVSIMNISKGKKMAEMPASLDQKNCRYAPHVVLLPAGAKLKILNNDGILHNIHTHSTKNPAFNRAQPKFRKEIDEKFAFPETIQLTCDVHAWMSGWLIVEDHPYYTVTDANGAFHLTDVPPGDYEVQFWQETLGEVTRPVSVQPHEETKVTVEMVAKP